MSHMAAKSVRSPRSLDVTAQATAQAIAARRPVNGPMRPFVALCVDPDVNVGARTASRQRAVNGPASFAPAHAIVTGLSRSHVDSHGVTCG